MDIVTEHMAAESIMIAGGDDDDYDRKLKQKPPPFLTKTYELVDDPDTNCYITWNASGTGFIIHDHNKFSAHVLPNLFKTSNFSSFVYQLNTYGFRKISWERYEYANQWFQAGKKHWLINIKRRNTQSENPRSGRKRARSTPDQNPTTDAMEEKIDALMTEQNDMKRSIQSLKQSMDRSEGELASIKVPEFPEFEEEKTNVAVLLKQLVHEFLEKTKKVEHAESVDIVMSPADDGLKSDEVVGKTTEKIGGCEFWMETMVEGEAGIGSNSEGRQEDLIVLHSISMAEYDEMMAMASDTILQQEITVSKPSDLDGDGDDDAHFELWA